MVSNFSIENANLAPERCRRKGKHLPSRFTNKVKLDLGIGDAATDPNLIAAARQAEQRDAGVAVAKSAAGQNGLRERAVAR